VALAQFDKALTDLETVTRLKPDDFAAQDRLNYVRAKLVSPRPVAVAPVTTPAPPPPQGMSLPLKIGLGAGALIVIIIIAIVLMRRKSRGY
jgi:hypothetical protein